MASGGPIYILWIKLVIQQTRFCWFLNIINESAYRNIWIITEIILAPSRIRTHQGRVMQLMKQALYLQATSAG